MKTNFFILVGLAVASLTIILDSSANTIKIPDIIKFQESKDCVAWKTRKRMFLVNKKEAAGINCNIQTKFEENESDLKVQVLIPIEDFDSGEEERDQEVLKILGAEKQPKLVFTTNISKQILEETTADKATVEIPGILKVNQKDYNVTFRVSKTENTLYKGVVKSSYSAFDIEPPSVAGGLIAKVYDELDLYFRINYSQ